MTHAQQEGPLVVSVASDGALWLTGDLDMAGVPIVEAALLGLDVGNPIVINVGGLSFIDSSGLRVLLAAAGQAERHGGHIELRSVGTEVARLLDITGTADHFVVDERP